MRHIINVKFKARVWNLNTNLPERGCLGTSVMLSPLVSKSCFTLLQFKLSAVTPITGSRPKQSTMAQITLCFKLEPFLLNIVFKVLKSSNVGT